MASLVTGEAVALDLRPAALPSRMLAAAIDGVIEGALLVGFFVLIGVFASGGSTAAVLALGIAGYVAVGLGYPVLFETLMQGRSPGKAAMGLRVVRDDAGPIAFRHAFVRGLTGLIVERPGFTIYSAAVISSVLSERGKRLGDLLAGTTVVRERVVGTEAPPAQMPPQLAGWASTLDLSGLPDDLAGSARAFLGRSPTMHPAARDALGNQLCQAVAAVVAPPAPPGTPGWAYLSAVLAERRRRAEQQHAAPPVTHRPPPAAPPPALPPSAPAAPAAPAVAAPASPAPPASNGGFAPPA